MVVSFNEGVVVVLATLLMFYLSLFMTEFLSTSFSRTLGLIYDHLLCLYTSPTSFPNTLSDVISVLVSKSRLEDFLGTWWISILSYGYCTATGFVFCEQNLAHV